MKSYFWEILPRKDYRTSSSQIPLMLRVRINGKYFRHMLGITIPDLKYWDKKNVRVRNNPGFKVTESNRILANFSAKVTKILADAQISGRFIDRDEFKRLLFHDEMASTGSFFNFCEEEIQHMKKTGFARETIRSYSSYVSKLRKFKPRLAFTDIRKSYIRDLDEYLVSIGNKENTRQKMFAFLNTMLNRAKDRGIISENILYHNNPVKKKEGQRLFLTMEELQVLENLMLSSPYLDNVLSYFLFACYTGLRFTDLRNLRFSDIVKIEGQPHIRIIMHKTKDEVAIPLIPKAQALFPASGFPNQKIFQVRCNQVSNRDLKAIMKQAGITKTITMHCARHTFATISLSLGVDIMVISKVLGHKDLGTTRIYAKLQDKRKIEEMKKWG